jgi:hypothetical protein
MRKLLAALALIAAPAFGQVCDQSFNLRSTACPAGALDCTNKGSTLTSSEVDANFVNVIDLCKPFDVASTALSVQGDWTFLGASVFGDGAGTLAGKVEIGGVADVPQLVIEGHSTQTSDIFVIQNDADTELVTVDNLGALTAAGGLTTGATAAPEVVFDDSNTTVETEDAKISANATDAVTAQEDVDLTVAVQVNSVLTDRILVDADGPTSFLNSEALFSNLGIEFTESDTNPTCAAGDYGIYADLSETALKKCENGATTDLGIGAHVLDGANHTVSGQTAKQSLQALTATTFGFAWPRMRSHATDCTALTDGLTDEVCWEIDANVFYVCEPSAGDCDTPGEWSSATAAGDGVGYDEVMEEGAGVTKRAQLNFIGSGVTCVDNGGSTRTDCTFTGGGAMPDQLVERTASALLPLEHGADSIPPMAKEAGTNVDLQVLLFDAATDECRGGTFVVSPDLTATGSDNVTFRVYWYSSEASPSGNIMWDFRHVPRTEGESWDAALTTEAATADATGTQDSIVITSWTETVTNTGWAANDVIEFEVCRDADNASDTLGGDAYMMHFSITIPQE